MKEKKNILIAAGVAVLVIGIVLCCVCNPFASPKEKVVKALSKSLGIDNIFAAGENAAGSSIFRRAYVKDAEEAYQILLSLSDSNVQGDIEVKLNELEGDSIPELYLLLNKCGIHTSSVLNREDKKACTDFSLNFSGFELTNGKIYQDSEHFSVEIPDLLDGYVSVKPDTFTEDYNASSLASLLGKISDDNQFNYSIDQYADAALPDIFHQFTLTAFFQTAEGREALLSLYKAIEVEKTGKEDLLIQNSNMTCTNYSVFLPKEANRNFLEAYMSWAKSDIDAFIELHPAFSESFAFSASLEEFLESENLKDYTLNIYLDAKDNFVECTFQDNLNLESELSEVSFCGMISEDECKKVVTTVVLKIASDSKVKQYNFSAELADDASDSKMQSDVYSLQELEDDYIVNEYMAAINYDRAAKHMDFSLTYTDEYGDTTEYSAAATLILNADNHEAGLEVSKFCMENTSVYHGYKMTYQGKILVSAFEGEVKSAEGKEYKILEMKLTELMDLASEINENWKKTKLYQMVESVM